MEKKVILTSKELKITLQRLSCHILENHPKLADVVLIGLQPRGVFLTNRIVDILKLNYSIDDIDVGCLDITFFRDDFRRHEKTLKPNQTKIDFLVENKHVILLDDVLYTGRSVNAALSAIQSFGRPKKIELLCLIDRRFSRQLPIQPDYKGKQVDAIAGEYIMVSWEATQGKDEVLIINKDTE